jgi:hypothetical protein
VWLHDLDEKDSPGAGGRVAAADASDDDETRFIELSDNAAVDGATIKAAVRSSCGVAQGCPVATFAAIAPMHMSLHAVQEEFFQLGVVCLADDAYYTAPADTLYPAFERVRQLQLRDLNLRSNMGKVKVVNPMGEIAFIQPALLEAQGGEIEGFKCVGAFVAPATAAGDAWRMAKLTDVLKKRLKPLARVNDLDLARKPDDKKDVAKLRFDLIKNCAHAKPYYWMRCMPPHITQVAIDAAVEKPLRTAFELLTNAQATPLAQRNAAWEQATLPLQMSGVGIGGHGRVCIGSYSASILTMLPPPSHCRPLHIRPRSDCLLPANVHSLPKFVWDAPV